MSTTSPDSFCPTPPGQGLPTAGPAKSVDPRATAGADYNRLCTNGLKPHLLTGLVRDLLVGHFADVTQLEQYDLRGYLWRPGDGTGIVVESHYRWTPKLSGSRPACIVKRNSVQNRRLSIGRLSGVDVRTGAQEYSKLKIGSHTVFCWADTGPLAEILAAEVETQLDEFGTELCRHFGLMSWEVMDTGPVDVLEETKEGFVVPVTVGWAYDRSWRLEREPRATRTIALSRLLDLA